MNNLPGGRTSKVVTKEINADALVTRSGSSLYEICVANIVTNSVYLPVNLSVIFDLVEIKVSY